MVEIQNFLTQDECSGLIKIIEKNHQPSTVVSGSGGTSIDDKSRTSSTCNLSHTNPLVKSVFSKIANHLGLDEKRGENIQGQLYEVGQYFRPHHDFFSGPAYNEHCLHSGNRTHTLMIYLNDDFEGGGTNFPKLNTITQPETGKAVTWENMIDGQTQEDTIHEGMPVTSGKKYIITSWWREREWGAAKPAPLKVVPNIPKLTDIGFDVVKVPEHIWGIIQDSYHILKDRTVEEDFPGKETFIQGGSQLMSYDNIPHIRGMIHNQLLPIHREFAGVDIEPTFVYGIRSYLRGATLAMHTDRIETHHVSSIIIVDKDLKCGCQSREFGDDWPLDIKGHDGNSYKVYAEPGDMILYESALCEHGRTEPFQGTFYRNFFMHYKIVQ